ncbi:hypothetical protein A3E39_02135 [Candidatus Uhrbacteria bacterium RIFCSPHIGHO2_12_FULL_60_25]|uniref:TrbL/VirB6 plasmid conjugal transfer protein n=1 Tax=Candidatus Uhrbacteria bacterium RIFCSPHIGHO2_12_FULL_60_25 TaxID=1802399 RepID=A0A1F7ULF9_9BACT|nr:MAG: hypothetical protein A3D73_00690 [Candidatus Uhrbacteria bacterium RIFCSPHIGHO2_02_FULL_60_44]OGL78584.1 MAG: hypothetical protein A3E39_02135 [Candidatus Uhrbacteria bacterium RIFCSPHIGHO2_12_FULL_60_25]
MPSTIPERVGADVRRRLERAWIASVGFVTVLGIMAPGGVKAEVVQDFINYIMLAVSFILQWVLFFMGKLVLLITNVVVDVAQYNSFVTAAPVMSGWPLVRDVVNMFFIVVLLVTAFSTIIQWKKFDYRKILPKLLLMAVLVNFSKQLIGLLIDFSQILMLTFVNGFKAAAAGNFVKALKLDKMMTFDPQDVQNQAQGKQTEFPSKDSMLLKIVLSEFLGVFFMGTTIVMLLIMLVYLLVRVVGLWIALIFSPAALFVTALSGTPVASKVSLVGDKYWSRLGAMLSGGPIMAFFLWLTLSTVQGGDIVGFTVEAPKSEETVSYFSSAIGNTQDVATYFVALIMLLMGVEAAVAVSGEIGSTFLSGAVGKIQTGGMAATKFAAYGGMAAVAGYAARGAGRAAERKLELRERLGRGLQGVAARGGVIGGLATAAGAGTAGAALRRGRAGERAEAAKRVEGATFGMDATQRMQYLTNASRGLGEKSREAGVMLAKQQMSPEGTKVIQDQFVAEGTAKGLGGATLAAYAQSKARDQQGAALGRLDGIATARGDQDMLKEVREWKEKRPDLLQGEDFEKARHGLMGMTPEEMATTVKAEAFKDTRVADAVIQRMLKPDGTLDETSLDYEKLAKGRGLRAELIKQRHAELAAEAQAGGQPLSISTMNQAFAASNMAGAYMARVEEGGRVRYVSQSAEQVAAAREAVTGKKAAAAGGEEWEKPIRRESEINAAKERLARARAEGAPPERMAEVQQGMMAAGAPMTEAFGVDQKGTFSSDQDRAAFSMTMQNVNTAAEAGRLDMSVVQNMDFDLLQQNPGGRNEARSVFIEKVSTDGLRKAAVDATGSQNRAAQRRVTQMAQVVDMEGARAEKTLAQANLKLANKMDVGQITGDYEKAKKSGDMSGFQRQLDAINAESGVELTQSDVSAMSKRLDMNADPTLQAYKKNMSARGATAARRFGKGVVAGGAAVAGAAAGGAAAVGATTRRFATPEGRTAAGVAGLERTAARQELRGAVTPPIAPAGPGGPPRRRPDVPPPGPRPTPPSPPPPPPPSPTIPDLEVPPPRRRT